jgi:hypothetical protein
MFVMPFIQKFECCEQPLEPRERICDGTQLDLNILCSQSGDVMLNFPRVGENPHTISKLQPNSAARDI